MRLRIFCLRVCVYVLSIQHPFTCSWCRFARTTVHCMVCCCERTSNRTYRLYGWLHAHYNSYSHTIRPSSCSYERDRVCASLFGALFPLKPARDKNAATNRMCLLCSTPIAYTSAVYCGYCVWCVHASYTNTIKLPSKQTTIHGLCVLRVFL